MKYFNPQLLHKQAASPFINSIKRFTNSVVNLIPDAGKSLRNRILAGKPLRELHPGTTPLPKQLQFKHADTKELLRGYDKNGFAEHRIDGIYSPASNVVTFTKKHPITRQTTEYPIPFELQPSWKNGERLWDRITTSNITNKEAINLQAGSPTYYDELMDVMDGISKPDQIRAGIRISPRADRIAFGNRNAIKPEVFDIPGRKFNGEYRPDTGEINIINPYKQNLTAYAKNQFVPTVDDLSDFAVFPGSSAQKGVITFHELGHSGQVPRRFTQISTKLPMLNKRLTKFHDQIGVDDISLQSPLFIKAPPLFQVGERMTKLQMTAPRSWGSPRRREYVTKLTEHGYDQIPANPAFRRPDFRPVYPYPGKFSYAYNQNEITNANAALSRGISATQEAMKRNRQAYIKANFKPEDIDEFLKMPRIPRSVQQFDQRYEFFARHPEFMFVVGAEPSRNVSRYFMLERESRNPWRTPAQRRTCRDMLDFMRANYGAGALLPPLAAPFIYGQMQQNDQLNTTRQQSNYY